MSSNESSDYHKMPDEDSSPKLKFTRGDLIVPNK